MPLSKDLNSLLPVLKLIVRYLGEKNTSHYWHAAMFNREESGKISTYLNYSPILICLG